MLKRSMSALLSIALLLSSCPVVPAVSASGGLCAHHTVHEGCGYVEPVPAVACGHVHDDACYTVEAVCVHTHDESCGEAGESCGHVCSQETGCIVKHENCSHVHDEICGYAEAVDGQHCNFFCEICSAPVEEPPVPAPTALPEVEPLPTEIPATTETVPASTAPNPLLPQPTVPATDPTAPSEAPGQGIPAPDSSDPTEPTEELEEDISGQIPGGNLSWKLTADGILTISGEGPFSNNECPWKDYVSFITEVVIEDGVTSVNSLAFVECFSLKKLTIADSVTEMGGHVFSRCKALTEVKLPADLAIIPEFAFASCSSLKTVTIPEGVVTIDYNAFSDCSALEEVNFPAGLENIKGWAFFGCTKLAQIQLPDSLKTIGKSAFSGCDALTEVIIPAGVNSIGEYAFYRCDNLKTVTLPGSITEIAASTFESCSALEEIVIPASVTTIWNYAFSYCENLKKITFTGDAPSEIADTAFQGVTADVYVPEGNNTWTDDKQSDFGGSLNWWEDASSEAGATSGACGDNLTWNYDVESKTLTISGTGEMWNLRVTKTPWNAYTDEIEKLVVEEGVQSISQHAFWGCEAMTSVSLPNGLQSIGSAAFLICQNLTEINLPDTLVEIHDQAFDMCRGVKTLYIPASVTFIGMLPFGQSGKFVVDPDNEYYYSDDDGFLFSKDKTVLHQAAGTVSGSYTVPDGVTVIHQNAFSGCRKLREVVLPNGVTGIGAAAFSSCDSLENIRLPGTLTWIDSAAFSNCQALKSITIPASVNQINDHVFAMCDALHEIRFEGSAPQLGEEIFENVTAKAYYPVGDDTWTDSVRQSCGGNITWVPYSTDVWEATGTCGADVTWVYSGVTHTLTISGTGRMYEFVPYKDSLNTPWADYAEKITSVVVEEGVIHIGNASFQHLNNLQSVSLPGSLTSIGKYAFAGCTSLTDIDFPYQLETIGEFAFLNCTGLTRVDIPDSVTNDLACAFVSCTNLDTVILHGAGITAIGTRAFEGCSRLNQFIIHNNNLTRIGDSAFRGCSSLTGFSLPEGLTSIGNGAFYGMASLFGVHLPESLTTLGDQVFAYCEDLGNVEFPAAVTSLGNSLFEGCKELDYVIFKSAAPSFASDTFRDAYLVVYYPDGYPGWESAVQQTYGGNPSWVSYDLATSGTCGSDATWTFDKETGTLTITGTGVIHGNNTHHGVVNSHLQKCQPWYFVKEQIRHVVIEEGITEVGYCTFHSCENLQTVQLPQSLAVIGEDAFGWCTSLTSIELPENLTSIGEGAFRECVNLESIQIPDGVTEIGDWAFFGCEALNAVSVPNGITSIGIYAFAYTALESVVIPEGVLEVPGRCFIGCDQLTSVTLPASLTRIGEYAFSSCHALVEITLPDGLEEMGDYAFQYCHNLKTVNIPKSLKAIPQEAFNGCYVLSNLEIPASVESIGSYAFNSCYCVKEIRFLGDAPAIDAEAFRGVTATVYYPTDNTTWTEEKRQNYGGNLTWYVPGTQLEGTCGDGLNWSFDTDTSTLTISGEGYMDACYDGAPWAALTEDIKAVILEEGIHSISKYAFAGCTALESITFPESLWQIHNYAFDGCTGLKDIYFTGSFPAIDYDTFRNVTANAHYPAGYSWTAEKLQNYGGELTWIYEGEQISSLRFGTNVEIAAVGQIIELYVDAQPWDAGTLLTFTTDSLVEVIETENRSVTLRGLKPGITTVGVTDAYSGLTDEVTVQIVEPTVITAPYSQNITIVPGNPGGFFLFTPEKTMQYMVSLENVENPNYGMGVGISLRERDTNDWVDDNVYIGDENATRQVATLEAGTAYLIFANYNGNDRLENVTFCLDPIAPVTGIDIPEEEMTVWYCTEDWMNEFSVSVRFLPDNSLGEVTWSSSDPDTVTVGWSEGDRCYPRSQKPGTAVITATCGEFTDSITVNVQPVPQLQLGVVQEDVCDYGVQKPYQFTAEEQGWYIFSAEAEFDLYTYIDEGIMNDSQGRLLKEMRPGETCYLQVAGMTADSEGKSYQVLVQKTTMPDSMELHPRIEYWESLIVYPVFAPESGYDRVETWTVSDETILKNNNSEYFQILGSGEVTITATTANGLTASKTIVIGNCGRELSWLLADGVLTISGTGKMADLSGGAPWKPWAKEITAVKLEAGVTSIGHYAFRGLSKMKSVTIPETVTEIGEAAFGSCTSLMGITIPEGVRSISCSAFAGCSGLISLTFPTTLEEIGPFCFDGCKALHTLTFTGNAPDLGTESFVGLSATVYYPAGNPTWTKDTLRNYGGKITWRCEGVPITSLSVADDVKLAAVGQVVQLHIGYAPRESVVDLSFETDSLVEIVSANPYNFSIRALSAGETTVTVTDKISGLSDSVTVTIVEPERITSPYQTEITLPAAKDKTYFVFTPEQTMEYMISVENVNNFWGSSTGIFVTDLGTDSWVELAYLDDLSSTRVTATLNAGTDYLIYTEHGGDDFQKDITFRLDPVAAVTGMAFEREEVTVWMDKEGWWSYFELPVIFQPAQAMGEVTWTIQDPEILSLYDAWDNRGWFEANKPGTTVITATCGDYSDSITVTVAYAPELTLGVPMEAVCDYGYVKLFNFTAPEDGVYIISVDSDAEMLLYTDEHSPSDANGNIIKMMNAGETACIQVYGMNVDADQKPFTIRVDKPAAADTVGMSFQLNGSYGILYVYPAYAPGTLDRVVSWSVSDDTILKGSSDGPYGQSYQIIGSGFVEISLTTETGLTATHPIYIGRCGNSAAWMVEDVGVMTIAGTGDLPDYRGNQAPWALSGAHIDTVVVAEGITSIGDNSFWGTNVANVARVFLPDSVTRIGVSAFYNCTALTQITLPDSIVEIDDFAFENCTNLASIAVPEGVERIGDNAFLLCSGLTSAQLPESLTSIGGSAFAGCTGLTEITIPAGVTEIADGAFYDCTELKTITFLGDFPGLQGGVLGNVTATAYYPAGNATWTKDVRQNYGGTITWKTERDPNACGEDLTWALEGNTLVITGSGDMDDYEAGQAPWYAYRDSITAIRLPDALTHVGSCAFYGLSRVLKLETDVPYQNFPKNVESIGDQAFRGCAMLQKIELPESLTTLGSQVFRGCKALQFDIDFRHPYFIVKDNILYSYNRNILYSAPNAGGSIQLLCYTKSIADYAFADNTAITGLLAWGALTTVGEHAFEGCTALEEFSFLGKAPAIGEDAFKGVTATGLYLENQSGWSDAIQNTYGGNITWKVSDVLASWMDGDYGWVLHADGTMIFYAEYTHYGNTLPSGCKPTATGPSGWYNYRDSIRHVIIPAHFYEIGDYAFHDCKNLETVTFESGEIRKIGAYAFAGCTSLEKIYLNPGFGYGVTIGERAFQNCTALAEVALYQESNIGAYAFSGCSGLDYIYINSAQFKSCSGFVAESTAFYGVTATVLCPNGVTLKNQSFGGSLTWQNVNYGMCGPDAYWSFNSKEGRLTISGRGTPSEYTAGDYTPWRFLQDDITSIYVTDGITGLPRYLFEYCEQAETVRLPETLTALAPNAFNDCGSLNNLLIPRSVKTFDDYGFNRCESLTDIYYLGTEAEWNTIPFAVKSADPYYSGCGSRTLHFLTWNESTATCTEPGLEGHFAFPEPSVYDNLYDAQWNPISELRTVPHLGHSIQNGVCERCGFTNGDLGNGVTWTFLNGVLTVSGTGAITEADAYAQWNAFAEEITTWVIGEGITQIEPGAFAHWHSLADIQVSEENEAYCHMGGILYSKDGQTLVCYPGGRTAELYTVPEGVTAIADQAFLCCGGLEQVLLPESLETIGTWAFAESSVERVYFQGDCPAIAEDAFGCVTAKAYYPVGNPRWTQDNLQDYGGTLIWKAVGKMPIEPLEITSQPENFEGGINTYAKFTVGVNKEDVTYQWYYSSDNGETWQKSGSAGYNTKSLTIQIKDYRLSQLYRCEITDSEGDVVTSNAVSMLLPPSTIEILKQPADVYGAPAEKVTISLEATGEGLKYQWYYSLDGGETWSQSWSSGYNTNALSPVLRAYNSGRLFKCLITDKNGNTQWSDIAMMELASSEVVIHTQPASYTGKANDLTTFTVVAEGTNLEYRWYYSDNGGETWQESYNTGYDKATIQVRLYAYRSGYQYKCVLSSGGQVKAETEPVVLSLWPRTAKIVSHPMNAGAEVYGYVTFQVKATGENLQYQWQYSSNGGETWTNSGMEGSKTNTLRVQVIKNRDGQMYRCQITDDSGVPVNSQPATLRVGAAPVITSQPESFTGAVGETAVFTVTATGKNLKYQWQYSNNGGETWTDSGSSGNKIASLSVVVAAHRNGQQYRCVITNEFGSVISEPAILTVK